MQEYCDDMFLLELSKSIAEEFDGGIAEGESELEYYTGLINSQLNKLSSFADGTFEDERMGNQAVAYIQMLQQKKEALALYDTDRERVGER